MVSVQEQSAMLNDEVGVCMGGVGGAVLRGPKFNNNPVTFFATPF